jgi:phenylpropionate dioxygenase-like ring-hydroxylating dioxygenase large terminal subunit
VTTSVTDLAFTEVARRFWHPVARSTDVAAGVVVPVQLLGEALALWRAPNGRVGLVDDRCVHRGTALSGGRVGNDGCLRCPYHGWTFDAAGVCTAIPQVPDRPVPPTAAVPAYAVDEHAGLIWACLAGPARLPCPQFPEAERPGWRSIIGPPVDWSCTASRNVENFIDMAHLGWIHAGTFGNPDIDEVAPYTVRATDDGAELCVGWPYPARIAIAPNEAPLVMETEFDYRVVLPFTVRLESRGMGVPNALLHAVAPLTPTTCRTFWVVAVPDDGDLPDDLLIQGQLAVYEEDRWVVETQRPAHVPLDPAAELHLPFDRYAVAYRRALADLGF